MLNKKGVQNSESNYLSNVLWNFKSKNEENGSQTSSNNSSSKNNPVENMDIETIKLNEKDDEKDDYMNNIEKIKDINEIKNEPIALMEIESESELDKEVEKKEEKKIEKDQSVPVIKKFDEKIENNIEKNFKNKTESKIKEKKNSKFIETTERNKNLKKKVIFKVVKSKTKIEKKESIYELSTKYNGIDDNNDFGENEKLLPIQNYEQHDGNPFHIQTKSHDDEILDQTKCNFYSILSSNQNTTEVLFDTNHDGNEEFRNRVNNFVDEKTSPYSN